VRTCLSPKEVFTQEKGREFFKGYFISLQGQKKGNLGTYFWPTKKGTFPHGFSGGGILLSNLRSYWPDLSKRFLPRGHNYLRGFVTYFPKFVDFTPQKEEDFVVRAVFRKFSPVSFYIFPPSFVARFSSVWREAGTPPEKVFSIFLGRQRFPQHFFQRLGAIPFGCPANFSGASLFTPQLFWVLSVLGGRHSYLYPALFLRVFWGSDPHSDAFP